jgi:hypothetical protein
MDPHQRCLQLAVVLGLPASVTWRAMLAVFLLLVGSSMPERSKGRVQTKKDTLALQVGGWA